MVTPRVFGYYQRASAVLCCALFLAGCVSSSSGRSRSTLTPSAAATIVDIGKAAETRAGNTVAVDSYRSPLDSKNTTTGFVLVAAHIFACASADAPVQTGAAHALFRIETSKGTLWPAVADVKKPPLPTSLIPPGHCARGWVTFKVPKDQTPRFVVLTSSTIVKWRIM
jgi:hypothetical protein